jgi:hypothetical protein
VTLPVTLRREITADFQALPNDALRREALIRLTSLKDNPFRGRRLRAHPSLGDLSDCRKLYFDERPNVSPRYRIVYRVLPDEASPKSVDVVIIGPRASATVYLRAVTRLGRTTP